MLKVLSFPVTLEGRQTLFRFIWDGLVLGELPYRSSLREEGAKSSKQRIRQEARIQRKLVAISKVATEQDETRPKDARVLLDGDQSAQLEVEEIELIVKLMEHFPWGGGQVIGVADAFDFLASAPDAPKEPSA